MRFSLAPVLMLAAVGCQQTDPALEYKLQKLEDKLDAIDRRLANMPVAAAGNARPQPPQQPQRPQPPAADPNTVYSVPIGDAATRGPANAKVTIVEAADFA